jgi:pimeloyl-ACP methyl ester carboxylesterase
MTYAPVNGLQLNYEIHGSGRPLVLLHGGLLTTDLSFGPLLEPLAAGRQVIAVVWSRSRSRSARPPGSAS